MILPSTTKIYLTMKTTSKHPDYVLTLLLWFTWIAPLTSFMTTREEASIGLVRESYSKPEITIVYPEDDLEDVNLHGLVTVSRNNIESSTQTIVDLNSHTEPYILEGVILVMLPKVKDDFKDYTDKVINKVVTFKTFINRFRVVIGIHNLNKPSEEVLGSIQVIHRPNILLSVIQHNEDNQSELMIAEYNSASVRIRCTTLDISQCPEGPLSGSTIRVAYDFWYPITFMKEDSQIGGFYQDVLLIVANRLNFTIEMVYNHEPGSWGKRLGNGTWTGLLGMLDTGQADLVSSAMIRSPQRIQSFDFSLTVSYMEMKLYTKRVDGARISIQNYFWEFDLYIWMCILGTALIATICMTIILVKSKQNSSLSKSSISVLNALINRGMAPSLANTKRISFKMFLLALFAFTTVLNVSYRGCLNAFLAVVIPIQRINNLDDVLSESNGISMWPGGELEVSLASEKEGSTERKLYNMWKWDPNAKVTSYEDGLKDIVKYDYVMLGEAESITVLKSYTCDILEVKDYRYMRSNLALTFEKGSRFREAFDREILNLKVSGVIDRLNEFYISRNKRSDAACVANSVRALGFNNVFTPFCLIPLGATVGITILVLEMLLLSTSPKNDLKFKTCPWCESACLKKLATTENILSLDRVSNYEKIQLLQQLLLATEHKHGKGCYGMY